MKKQHEISEPASRPKLMVVAFTLALTMAFVAMTACTNNGISGNGTVRVFLTDAPLDLSMVSAVNVTVTELSLKTAEDENGDTEKLALIGGEPWIVNLLDYQDGNSVLMAAGDVPSGEYSKIRFVVSAAELVMDDDGDTMTPDIVEPIFNPSGKVDIPVAFLVSEGTDLSITLDFDAELSVQVNTTNGQHPYILRPVINMVEIN